MSNSCILFRKFHFLIGSFDHLCSTRENINVELHPHINVVQFDVGILGRGIRWDGYSHFIANEENTDGITGLWPQQTVTNTYETQTAQSGKWKIVTQFREYSLLASA